MTIYNYENSLRSTECVKYLTQNDIISRYSTLTVLPIPTSKDGVRLTNTDTEIKDVLTKICAGSLVIGYDIPKAWTGDILSLGATVCDSGLDEDFLQENGRLTAECTMGVLLGSTSRSLGQMSFGVVGYGRIGKWLLRYLSYFSAKFTVYTRSIDTRLDLAQAGIFCEDSENPHVPSDMDILINTAPKAIFTKESLKENEGVRIIDLASGNNFPWCENVEKYPSIPAKMLPVSAGAMWGRSVERMLLNNT